VAPLILAARAAREDARLQRVLASELRVEVRRSVRRARVSTERAAAVAGVARMRRATRVASPWSGLSWRLKDDSLERILLPVD